MRASHHLDMGLRYLDEAICEFCDLGDPIQDGADPRVDPRVMAEMNKILMPYGLTVITAVEKDSLPRK